MMELLKEQVAILQKDAQNILTRLDALYETNSKSKVVVERAIDDYLWEVESLCVKSRIRLDGFRSSKNESDLFHQENSPIEVAGSIEVTFEGWLHITLNTLLPNCKYRVSGYIGNTISRLVKEYEYDDLPYFEKAFLAIVEYCNHDNHNALDNDNKGWKMIPNALKGRVIKDDNQFILSIGLFSKLSENVKCEIYVIPPEDGGIFMERFTSDLL